MATGRMIHKKLFINEHFIEFSLASKVLCIGIYVHTNDFACLKGSSIYLASTIFHEKAFASKIDGLLKEQIKAGFVEFYYYKKERFLYVLNFQRYQTIKPSHFQRRVYIPLHPVVIQEHREKLTLMKYDMLFPKKTLLCLQSVGNVDTKQGQLGDKKTPPLTPNLIESNRIESNLIESNLVSKTSVFESSTFVDCKFSDLSQDKKDCLNGLRNHWYNLFGSSFHWSTKRDYSKLNSRGNPVWVMSSVLKATIHLITKNPDYNKGQWKNMFTAFSLSEFYRTWENLSFPWFLSRIHGSKQGKESVTTIAFKNLPAIEKDKAFQWGQSVWDRLQKEGNLKTKQIQHYANNLLKSARIGGEWKTLKYDDILKTIQHKISGKLKKIEVKKKDRKG